MMRKIVKVCRSRVVRISYYPQVSRPSRDVCFCNNDKKYIECETSNIMAYCHAESEEKR